MTTRIAFRIGWVFAMAGVGCASTPHELHAGGPPTVDARPGRAIAVVRIQAPWYAPRFVIVGRFRDAVPEYESVANLENKYFTITEDRRFGGIYVWRSRADAERYHSAAWRADIRKRRGVDADLLVLDSPFLVDGHAALAGDPVGARSVRAPVTSALVLWRTEVEGAAAALAANLARSASGELLKAYVVTAGADRVGFIGLWRSRSDAARATDAEHLTALAPGLASGTPEVTLFDTPVSIDAELRGDR